MQWSAYSGSSYVYTSTRECISNAYLLFYEREEFFDYALEPDASLPVLSQAQSSYTHPEVLQAISNKVRSENERFWRSRNTFAPEFYSFVNSLWNVHSTGDENTVYFYKFVTNFFLTVLVRSKDYSVTADFLVSLIHRMN